MDGILGGRRHPLDYIFAPKAVAVIGATETPRSVGRTVLWNLLSNSFGGTVFPVNPKRSSVLGIKAYPDIAHVPEKADLAVIATPAPTVPEIIGQCVDAGVRGAVILSAGFREMGAAGAELERRVLEAARRGNMRIIGPNCLGVMNPLDGLNATFAHGIARPGNVAFISQSGALLTAILDWSHRELIGFSSIVSVGTMLDVDWGDLIDYLGDDPRTHSILIYMESIGDARSFLSAAREVSLAKPIIVLKAGRTEQAARAAGSHTGSLAGSDEVLEAAFRRCGALRVTEIGDLFSMAEVLARQPRPRGMRLTIVTNAGGPGVLATDALITGSGQLATLSPDTVAALDANLPAHWSHNNPVDVLGDAGPERYAQTLKTVVADPDSDGLLVILTPQDMTDPTETAKALAPYAKAGDKPVLASWMGGKLTEAGELILNQAGVPTFPYPDTAARAFNYMWRYSDNLRGLYETPALPQGADHQSDRAAAQRIISATMAQKRTILTETESKALLAAYGLPTVSTHLAETADEAVRHAERIGYPVVLKLFSETITHKTDVGGVQLNLANADAVRKAFEQIRDSVSQKAGPGHFGGTTVQQMVRLPDAYELIIGSTVDAQLGPVLLFGAGGQLVEVFRDRALALPPLTATLARRTMERTRILEALKGIRGRRPIDIAALEQLLVRFSTLVVEQPRIREIDINPLLASPEQMIALDARILLHDASIGDEQLPRPAIRPYPSQYAGTATLRDGSAVAIRPIRPEDEPLVIQFHASLSERSVRFRYFHQMKLEQRVAHERLIRICFNDYDRDLALVALRDQQILGIGRLNKNSGTQDAEFSLVIADGMQHKGLGTELLSRLIQIARDEKLTRISGTILPENGDMQRLCAKLGFRLTEDADENVVRAEMPLDSK